MDISTATIGAFLAVIGFAMFCGSSILLLAYGVVGFIRSRKSRGELSQHLLWMNEQSKGNPFAMWQFVKDHPPPISDFDLKILKRSDVIFFVMLAGIIMAIAGLMIAQGG